MILLYHKVDLEARTAWWVSAQAFDRQLAALAAYDVVHLGDYDSGNPRHAVITFDGVYENVYRYALPLLKKWGYPFELFVTGDYIGGDNAFDSVEPLARFCTLEQLREMVAHGGRVQWHTASHASLTGLDPVKLEAELTPPSALREAFPAPHLRWFAYPHGEHDAHVLARVRGSFEGALSCVAGNAADRHQLNRVTVLEDTRLDKSRVTVIVANFNYGAYLPEAMDSVLRQSMPPDEIILIDDCSTDGSQEIARRYEGRAKLVLNETNLGIVGNFNKAVGLSTGDYIAFLGADNRMRSDYVERCKTALDRDPGAAVAYTDMAIFGHRAGQLAQAVGASQVGTSMVERWPIYLWRFPDPTPEALAGLASRNFIHGSSMYRREVFDAVGGYRESGQPEDHHLFLRMLAAGWRAVRVPHPLVEYRQHSPGQANTVLGTQLELARLNRELGGAQSELAAAQAHLGRAQSELQAMRAELGCAQLELQATRDRLGDTQADASRLQQEVQRLTGELESQANKAARLAQERDEFEGHWRRADSDIRALLSTRSWQITKPLRFFGLLARGRWGDAAGRTAAFMGRQLRRLPPSAKTRLVQLRTRVLAWGAVSEDTATELHALVPMVSRRAAHSQGDASPDPLTASWPAEWPQVDLSVVTHNNGKWLASFVGSLEALDYPSECLAVRFVDNGSTDDTPHAIRQAVARLHAMGVAACVLEQENVGFGAGHNSGLRSGKAPFCLVTNIDLTFEPAALKQVVAAALTDPAAAAWELRQKPFEHPKYYDPVTGETNWNSHACVLLRRSAFEQVRGYDDNLFMYGEDVELSYRLRRNGWLLRYCPRAVVFHYSYQSAGEVKPLQYTGSTFANLYLRIKYGTLSQMAMVLPMALGLLVRPDPFPGARHRVARNLGKLLLKAPGALAGRKRSGAVFPFRLWDYELRREGAFHEALPLPAELPRVSIVTRTFRGREMLLREALLSAAHQTYPNVELVVVEDGGDTLKPCVESLAARVRRPIKFVSIAKAGRSAAGNAGLAATTGRWCMFLDDDDLLFGDHVETLVQALVQDGGAAAAYSLAWEVESQYRPGEKEPYTEVAYTVPPGLRQAFDAQVLSTRNFIPIQSLLFERRLYEERGGFDVDVDALEDWILWNVYADGNRFDYVPKITSMFRTPADTTLRQRRNAIFAQAYEGARARFTSRIHARTAVQPESRDSTAHYDEALG